MKFLNIAFATNWNKLTVSFKIKNKLNAIRNWKNNKSDKSMTKNLKTEHIKLKLFQVLINTIIV